MSAPLPVTVFSDYVCPYCYMGDGILNRLQTKEGIPLDVSWQPLELHKNTPPTGISLTEVFKLSADEARQQSEGLRANIEGLGLALNPPDTLYNTRKAHLLAEYARDHEKLDEVRSALFRAYWVDGRNLADDDVLADIAQGAGLQADEALARLTDEIYTQRLEAAVKAALDHKVRALPTFVFADKYVLYGAQPYFFLLEAVRTYQDLWQSGGKKAKEN